MYGGDKTQCVPETRPQAWPPAVGRLTTLTTSPSYNLQILYFQFHVNGKTISKCLKKEAKKE